MSIPFLVALFHHNHNMKNDVRVHNKVHFFVNIIVQYIYILRIDMLFFCAYFPLFAYSHEPDSAALPIRTPLLWSANDTLANCSRVYFRRLFYFLTYGF